MNRLSEIPIRLVSATPFRAGLGGGVHAILSELATLLSRLADGDRGGTIDLRSLPMGPQDRTALRDALGEGEVHATLNAEGLSEFQETSVPGVWWIEHRDRSGELVAELLEVAAVPAILACARDEIAAGPDLLRARIVALGPSAPKAVDG